MLIMAYSMSYIEFLDQIRDICKVTTNDAILITDAFNKSKKFMCFRVIIDYSTYTIAGSRIVNIYVNKTTMRVNSYRIEPHIEGTSIEKSLTTWLDQLTNDKTLILFEYETMAINNINPMVRKGLVVVEKIDPVDNSLYQTYLYDPIKNTEFPADIIKHPRPPRPPRPPHMPPNDERLDAIIAGITNGTMLKDGCIHTRHIADGAVTPDKLDRNYASEEEIIAARTNSAGTAFETLGERISNIESDVDALGDISGAGTRLEEIESAVMSLDRTVDEVIVTHNDNTDIHVTADEKESISILTTNASVENVGKVLTVDDTGCLCFDEVAAAGGSTTTETFTSNITLGGISSGTTIESGTDLESILKSLLVTYIPPAITLSISPSTTLYKAGVTTEPITMTAKLTKNSNPVTSLEFLVGGSVVHTITEGIADGGTFTYQVDDAFSSNTTFTVKATDGTEYVTSTRTIKFVNPYYYGIANSTTIDNFDGLTELLEERGTKSKTFTSDNQYICFAFDGSYSDLTSILDGNNFENIDSFTKTNIDVDGVEYKVYISNTPVTCANFKYTFK